MSGGSPFPGLDPYIEFCGLWPDFHARFINYWSEVLAEILPSQYEARIGERVQLFERAEDEVEPARKRIEPDVAVTRGPGDGGPGALAGAITLEPVLLTLPVQEEIRETYIEVLRRPEHRLVAVLELLRPSNKQKPGRSIYLAKRTALFSQE